MPDDNDDNRDSESQRADRHTEKEKRAPALAQEQEQEQERQSEGESACECESEGAVGGGQRGDLQFGGEDCQPSRQPRMRYHHQTSVCHLIIQHVTSCMCYNHQTSVFASIYMYHQSAVFSFSLWV